MIIRDLQYSCDGYMALALAQYEDLFLLVRGYLYGVRGAPVCMISAYQEGALWFLCILLVTPWRGVHAY